MIRIYKKYLYWFTVNATIMAMLLSGIEGWVDFSIILLWFTAIVGCLFINGDICKAVIKESIKKNNGRVMVISRYLNYTFDVVLGLYLAYAGYPILAAVYMLHIYGLVNLYDAQVEAFSDKLRGEQA